MSATSEKGLPLELSFVSAGRTSVAGRTDARRAYVLLSLVALAVVLRLYGISTYPLEGDEYGSLIEAKSVGLNWNSIIYSTVMHFWVRFGVTELWLRLPAALFGIATVPVLFKAAEKLGGWRAGVAAAALAATSPFNIYHSQEVRFYSLLMFAAATFMWATVSYVDSPGTKRHRLFVIGAAMLLIISHFLGVVGLWAQSAATFTAIKKRRFTTFLGVIFGLPILIFGLPLLPPVRRTLLHLYQIYGNAVGADVSTTPISLVSLAKIAFAFYAFVFGYHVYPLRLVLVIAGLSISGGLLTWGAIRLTRERKWMALAFTYAIVLIGVYLVLDSIGGRVASGVSPRHVAFVWPIFIVLISLGLSSFSRTVFKVLLAALLLVNAASLTYAWKKDWSYGPATDYRAAAEYASYRMTPRAAVLYAGRAAGPVDFYFPKNLRRADWYSYLATEDVTPLLQNERLIFVSDDWFQDRRRALSTFLRKLNQHYTCLDGRVDYPLFEYVCDRGRLVRTEGEPTQLPIPLSIYGFEFQDLKLPATVDSPDVRLRVIGASELPTLDNQNQFEVSVSPAATAKELTFLTNVTGDALPAQGTTVADAIVESKNGAISTFPIRMGIETASWDQTCRPTSQCSTVLQWHKRLALMGQSRYPGAWRDFQAGLHATKFRLPQAADITRVSIRYQANAGHIYVWAIALH